MAGRVSFKLDEEGDETKGVGFKKVDNKMLNLTLRTSIAALRDTHELSVLCCIKAAFL